MDHTKGKAEKTTRKRGENQKEARQRLITKDEKITKNDAKNYKEN
jgi:hypothetical protein